MDEYRTLPPDNPAASTAWMVLAQARIHMADLPDARFRVSLTLRESRLHVEREHIGHDGLNLLVAQEFQRLADFDRWWGTDPLRFEHPVLHLRVRRDASALCSAGLCGDPDAQRAG